MEVPQKWEFYLKEILLKWMIWGYPHFRKPPIYDFLDGFPGWFPQCGLSISAWPHGPIEVAPFVRIWRLYSRQDMDSEWFWLDKGPKIEELEPKSPYLSYISFADSPCQDMLAVLYLTLYVKVSKTPCTWLWVCPEGPQIFSEFSSPGNWQPCQSFMPWG